MQRGKRSVACLLFARSVFVFLFLRFAEALEDEGELGRGEVALLLAVAQFNEGVEQGSVARDERHELVEG